MGISRFAIKRSVLTIMLTVSMVAVGVLTIVGMSSQLLPNFNIPVILIQTRWSGASPDDVEKLVTSEIEDSLTGIEDMTDVQTYSAQGMSTVVVNFEYGTEAADKVDDIRAKVDNVRNNLPSGADDSTIQKIDVNARPVVIYNIYGADLIELNSIAENIIKPRLEKVSGVSRVDVSGGLETEVRIELNETKINSYGLNLQTVSALLSAANVNRPLGNVDEGLKKFNIKMKGEIQSLQEVKDVIIYNKNGNFIRVGDIADVRLATKDVSSYARQDSREAVRIGVYKMDDGNTVEVVEDAKKMMEEVQSSLPDNIKSVIASDDSTAIGSSIGTVTTSAMQGLVLAGIVLLIFLKNFRAAIIVAVSIPVSVIFTFALLPLRDINLNLISLMGLALGIGMLVDNAVVVMDNIFRHITELKEDKITAAANGASEMSFSIIASTLTTVAVFIPIILKQGMAREVFHDMSFSIAFSLSASLFIALTFVPMAAAKLLDPSKVTLKEGKVLGFIKKYYLKVLDWALNHRVVTLMLTIVIFFGVVIGGGSQVKFAFFPEMDEGKYKIVGTLPKGLEISKADEVARIVEEVVVNDEFTVNYSSLVRPDQVTINVQAQKKDPGGIGELIKRFRKSDEEQEIKRKESLDDIMAQVRSQLVGIPDVNFVVELDGGGGPEGGGASGDIQLNLQSDNSLALQVYSSTVLEGFRQIDGFVDQNSSFEGGNPEIKLEFDRDKADYYGLNVSTIASYISTQVKGSEIFSIKAGGQEVDVTIRYAKSSRESLEDIYELEFAGNKGTVKLRDLANITLVEGNTQIDKKNRKQIITISANLEGMALSEGVAKAAGLIQTIGLPPGITYSFGGDQEQMRDVFGDLLFGLAVSIYVIYFILAAQFESFTMPGIILGTLPLSIIGVILGLVITGTNLDIMVMVGIVMLAGIVVNNAIVLVDYINLLRAKEMSVKEAIREAGRTRLRPVLMTTMTTVLGMVPLAVGSGEGSEFYKGMAVAVIFGLVVSTLLTLIFIPVLYSIEESIRGKFRHKLKFKSTVISEEK
jgi:HAE1 family hydrophobic/amphiphilic exporter-1